MIFALYGNEDFVSILSVDHITQESFSDDDFFESLSRSPPSPFTEIALEEKERRSVMCTAPIVSFAWESWRPIPHSCGQQMKNLIRELGFEMHMRENQKALKRLRICMREISVNFSSVLSLYPFWRRRVIVKNIAMNALRPSDFEAYEAYINGTGFEGLFGELNLILMAEEFENFVCKKLSLKNSHQKLKVYFDASRLNPAPARLNDILGALRQFSHPEMQEYCFEVCRECLSAAAIGEELIDTGETLLAQLQKERVSLWDCALGKIKQFVGQRTNIMLVLMEKAIERQYVKVVERLKGMISSAVVHQYFRSKGKVLMLSDYYDVAAMEAMLCETSVPLILQTTPTHKNVFLVQDTRRCAKDASSPAES